MPTQPRRILELDVHEVSLVARPANVYARVMLTKAASRPATREELAKKAHELIRRRAELFLADDSASMTPFRAAGLALFDCEELAASIGLTKYGLAAELAKAQKERDIAEKRMRAHARRREPGL